MLPELHAGLPAGLHLTVGTHALATLLAVLAGARLAARRAPGTHLGWIAPVAACVVLAGSRLLYWLIAGGGWTAAGGLASMGGLAAGLAAARPLARLAGVPVAVLLDALVPAALLGLGIGRIGCFLGGCCYGAPTTLAWGVVFPEIGEPPRHPLQLYSAAVDLAITWGVCRRRGAPGVAAARGLAAFAMARFALEAWRDPGTTDAIAALGLTLPQVLCLLLLLGVRPFLGPSLGGLSGPDDRVTVASSMRITALLLCVLTFAAARPSAAIDAEFEGTLAVRPAHGVLDITTGFGGLRVQRWRLTLALGSAGVAPAAEPVTLSLGTDEVALPAGALTETKAGRRYVFRDDAATRGLSRLRLKRRSDGAWLVSFHLLGIDLARLVTTSPICEPLAFAIGNDEGASGVDLARRDDDPARVKLRGFCEIDECPLALVTIGGPIRPRHVVCPP